MVVKQSATENNDQADSELVLEIPLDRYETFVAQGLETKSANQYRSFDDLTGLKCRFFYHNSSIGVGFNATPYRSETGYVLVDNDLTEAHIDLRDGVAIKSVTTPPDICTDKTIQLYVYLKDKEAV